MYVALTELKQPKELNRYSKVDIDGVSVFYPKESVFEEEGPRFNLINSSTGTCLEVVGIYRGDDSIKNLKE